MTTTQQPVPADATVPSGTPQAGPGAIRVMAIVLWVVVGSFLAYGVAETALKASALFG